MKKQLIVLGIFSMLIIILFSGCIEQTTEQTITNTEWFQKGNVQDITILSHKDSLKDGGIGLDRNFYYCYDCDPWDKPKEYGPDDYHTSYANLEVLYDLGLKWLRVNPSDFHGDPLDWQHVETSSGVYSIAQKSDDAITDYANNGVNIILGLSVGNGENRPDITRFEDQDEVDIYVNWTRFMVNHFKDRVKYFEIWNEPDTDGPSANITWQNYVKIVNATAPAIKEECPECKVVIGAIGGVECWYNGDEADPGLDYLENVLQSGIATMVDAISWHPMYGTSPDSSYYKEYEQLIQDKIKNVAESEGFQGEYIAEEISWTTMDIDNGGLGNPVSAVVANKYLARGLVIHRGMDVIVIPQSKYLIVPNAKESVKIINNVLAGFETKNVTLDIQSESSSIRTYGFSKSDGTVLIAIWNDIVGSDEYDGVEVNLSSEEFTGRTISAIDTLNGYQQAINVEGSKINDLVIKDYPIFLKIE